MTQAPKHFARAALFALVALAGCATPPAVIPTAADIRGLKASGKVSMEQVFISGTGIGSGDVDLSGAQISLHA